MISIENESHNAWRSTSSSHTHHMVAINKLIKETSLLEVRQLIEVLKARENDLLRIQPIFASHIPDFRGDLYNVGRSVLPLSPGPTPPSSARSTTQWRTDNSKSKIWRAGDEKGEILSKSLPPLQGRPRRAQGLVTEQDIPPLQVLREEHEALPRTLLWQNENHLISMVQLNLLRLTMSPEYSAPLTKVQPCSPRKRRVSKFPFEDAGPDALSNWLRALRLHKYFENLKGMTPAELFGLDEEELQRRGVGTVGARTKLLLVCDECTKIHDLCEYKLTLFKALKKARDSLEAEKNS